MNTRFPYKIRPKIILTDARKSQMAREFEELGFTGEAKYLQQELLKSGFYGALFNKVVIQNDGRN